METKLDEVLKELEAKKDIKNLKSDALKLSERYLSSFSAGIPLAKKERDVLSYTFMRMRATHAATSFALNKINKKEGINSILDVGCGTGAAMLAALELFSPLSIDAVEVEKNMIKACKEIISCYDEKLLDKVNFINEDATKLNITCNYDLIITSYFLNELKHNDRIKLAKNLFNHANKYFVIIEPGTPQNHKEMMEIKDVLLDCGATLVSPCKCDVCPLLKSGDWCHFITRINRTKLQREIKGGSLGYEDEKFTYLVFSKDKQDNAFEKIIIRKPMIFKGRVQFKSCTKSGINSEIITKSNKEVYKKIKELGVGDEF